MHTKNKRAPKRVNWVVVALVGVLLLSAGVWLMWDNYVNGSEYRQMVKQCGTDRLIVGRQVPKTYELLYSRPTDPNYVVPAGYSHYFCAEQDAIDAGYSSRYNADGSFSQE